MRRLLGFCLLLGALLAAPPTATGQGAPQFGVALGVNVATLSAPADVGTRQMAAGGVVMRLGLPGPLSLEPRLLLSQKGATVQGEGGGSIRYGAGYLNLPVLLRVDGPSLGAVAPYGVVGGFGGVKVFEQQRAGGDLSFPLDAGTSFFRRTDAGLTAGVGGTVPLGERRLNLVLRYEHGLVDVAQSVDEQPYEQAPFPPSAETRTWAIMLRLGI